MRQPFFMQNQGRSRSSERVRERREARFDRAREEQAAKKQVDSADWYAQTLRRIQQQRGGL